MIGHDGRVKVLDFGLAKQQLQDTFGHETALPTANLTGEGRILGTVAYMAPEQALCSDSGDLTKGSVSVSVPAMSSSEGVVAPRARRLWP
jgi:serine/threonine protein kinase